jgi:hypothetical protein
MLSLGGEHAAGIHSPDFDKESDQDSGEDQDIRDIVAEPTDFKEEE